jgi:hypothetical protein
LNLPEREVFVLWELEEEPTKMVNEAARRPPEPPEDHGARILRLPSPRGRLGVRLLALLGVVIVIAALALALNPVSAGVTLAIAAGIAGVFGVVRLLAADKDRRQRLAELRARRGERATRKKR